MKTGGARSGTRARRWRASPARGLVAALLLAALTFALFSPASRNGFISLDDERYITGNSQVRRGLSWETARWALTSMDDANWYPLRRLSHLVDVELFGFWAGGHHLVSAAWHAAAAAVLFLALQMFTGTFWRSLAVASLFAAHPLQVESVAWAAERSNVLAGFFFALTLLLWGGYARRPGPGRYLAVLGSCALGLAAKPMLVTLPFVLVLLDFWPLGRMAAPGAPPWNIAGARIRHVLLEQAPLLVLAAATGALAAVAHRSYGALVSMESIPLGLRLANALLSYWRYLGKLLWPTGLGVFYPHPEHGLSMGAATLAGVLIAALSTLLALQARRRPWLIAGWLWYLGTLVPMIGIVQFSRQAMADRFQYIPAIGIFLALVWLVAEDLPARLRRPVVLGPAALAALAALAAVTVAQVRLWKDDLTLYTHTLAVTTGNWPIETSLGLALQRLGNREEAIAHYRAALRLYPYSQASYNLGTALFESGRNVEAEAAFREALRVKPDFAEAHNNLGSVMLALGRVEEAAAAYAQAVRLQPEDSLARHNLGMTLLRLGHPAEALPHVQEAVRLQPGEPTYLEDLGRLLSLLGRPAAAAPYLREARRLRGTL
jgi:tetratricopeptide (TPR) repeat protein